MRTDPVCLEAFGGGSNALVISGQGVAWHEKKDAVLADIVVYCDDVVHLVPHVTVPSGIRGRENKHFSRTHDIGFILNTTRVSMAVAQIRYCRRIEAVFRYSGDARAIRPLISRTDRPSIAERAVQREVSCSTRPFFGTNAIRSTL